MKESETMVDQANQSAINRAAWEACNIFRGAMDPFIYKDYVLATLFWKYILDVWQAKHIKKQSPSLNS